MKVSKEAVGRGGPWSERWKAWVRCSERANYKHGITPGDPLRYHDDDIHFVEDFVGWADGGTDERTDNTPSHRGAAAHLKTFID